MLQQLRIIIFFLTLSLFSFLANAVEDIELAESLILQDDCENALPILVAIYKSLNSDKKRTLLSLNKCAEKNLDYTLKVTTEKKIIQLDPKDLNVQMRYLDSLFYLSNYKELIKFSKKRKSLYSYDDYWMLLGRSFYEMNENEKSISVFETYLRTKVPQKKDEAYYWLIKNYLQLEEYSDARKYLAMLVKKKNLMPWLKDSIAGLQEYIETRDKRFSWTAKFQAGTDNNILREHDRISDITTLVDMYFDYNLINKTKNTLTLGLDINYQGYAQFSINQFMSVAPRIGQTFDITSQVKGDYLVSVGKSQTNFKEDQNYYFLSNSYYVPLSQNIELQPSVTYFENLNNNPIKQINISLLANFYLERGTLWIGPYYTESTSPQAEIDATSSTFPFVTKYSLTTRYSKSGIFTGYQMSIGDNWSLLSQYSMAQTKYKSIDLSSFNSIQVDNKNDRVDLNQSFKISLGYRQNTQWRYNFTVGYSMNNSKGFVGFNTTGVVPDNNYNQTQALVGITYRSL
jgi:hypothetical protein